MGVGSGRGGAALLIRGLKSRFAGHQYKWGSEDQQQLLKMNLAELEEERKTALLAAKDDSKEPSALVSKKVCQAHVEFDVWREVEDGEDGTSRTYN